MRYLLDTNVLAELVKRRPDARVKDWIEAQSPLDLAISVLSLGEVEQGIARLPAGARQSAQPRWARAELPTQFVGRLLGRLHGVDAAVAIAWGRLAGNERLAGRPLPVIDGLLLATAQLFSLSLVTRNVQDCAGRGLPAVPVLDPWTGTLHS